VPSRVQCEQFKMAYRKTEKVLAQLEAKRNSLIASAIDVIEKVGLDGLTTDLVCERAGVAAGLLYRYFPDKTELLAAVAIHLLNRDISAIRDAVEGNRKQSDALEIGLRTLIERAVSNYSIVSEASKLPLYREGLKRELRSLIQGAGVTGRPFIFDSLALGAILETAGSLGPKGLEELASALLRSFGMRVKAGAVV